jgi:Ran GTPase-activating protein (RanGAP) involved in mRNA processing and transport
MSWIDLSWNSFDAESAACLAEALAVNQTLTSIDLSANSLRDAGGQRIAACLLQNKHLQEIFLSLNNIGGKSCFIFSKV